MQATKSVLLDFTANTQLADETKANRILQKALRNTEVQVGKLIVRHTAVSGRAIMCTPELPALKTLQVIDFSSTNASLTALNYLPRFRALEMAFFDNCPQVILTSAPVVHENLQVLSLLGTRVFPGCAKYILENFPRLQQLSYTINPSDQKFLGLAPSKDLVRVSELSVRIRKVEGVWKALPLDADNNPIEDGQTLYLHEPSRKLYATPQENATKITARLDTSINLDTDFAPLPPSRYPSHLLDRALAYQKAAEIRKSNEILQ